MSWIALSLFGYLLVAVATMVDKYLLRTRIPEPAAYGFFVSVFSLFAVVFAPFGLGFFGWEATATALFSGALFVYGIVALYRAIKEDEVSRVAPMAGALVPVIIVVFLSSGLVGAHDPLGIYEAGGLALLVAGSVFFSLGRASRRTRALPFIIASSIFVALSFMLLKEAYEVQNFVSGFVWSRIGMFLGGCTLLFVPQFREDIFGFCCGKGKKRMGVAAGTVGIFVAGKTLGGVSYLFINYAVFLGSVAVVQALSGVQYAFVFVMSALFAFRWPAIYEERMDAREWAVKIVALFLVAAGIALLSFGKV